MSENQLSIRDFVAEEKKKSKSRIYSSQLAKDIMVRLLNEPEFKSHTIKVKDDKAQKFDTEPVKGFRKAIMHVLTDYGVDAKDAETILTSYKFKAKDVEGIIEFVNEYLIQYLSTGKYYKLADREDFVASIYMDEVAEFTKMFPKTDYETTVKKHKKLKAKSGAPKWQKVAHKNVDGKAVDVAVVELLK